MTTPQHQPDDEIWALLIPGRRDWLVTYDRYVGFDPTRLQQGSAIPLTARDVQAAIVALDKYVTQLNFDSQSKIGITQPQALALIATWARATSTRQDLLAAIDYATGSAAWRQGSGGSPIQIPQGTAALLAAGRDSVQRTWTAEVLQGLHSTVSPRSLGADDIADAGITGSRIIDTNSVELAAAISGLLSLSSLPLYDRLSYNSLVDTPNIGSIWEPLYNTGISYANNFTTAEIVTPNFEVTIPSQYLPNIQGHTNGLRFRLEYTSPGAGTLTLGLRYSDDGTQIQATNTAPYNQVITYQFDSTNSSAVFYADFPESVRQASPDKMSLYTVGTNAPINITSLEVDIEWGTLTPAELASVRSISDLYAQDNANKVLVVSATGSPAVADPLFTAAQAALLRTTAGLLIATNNGKLLGIDAAGQPVAIDAPQELTATEATTLRAIAAFAVAGNRNKRFGLDGSGNPTVYDPQFSPTRADNLNRLATLFGSPNNGRLLTIAAGRPALVNRDFSTAQATVLRTAAGLFIAANDGKILGVSSTGAPVLLDAASEVAANRLMPDPSGLGSGDAGDFAAWNHTNQGWDNASFGNTSTVTWAYDEGTATWSATANVTVPDAYTDADADERIEAYTGQDSPTGIIDANRLPPDLQILNRAVIGGGNRQWPNTDIQIVGPVTGVNTTPFPSSPNWGSFAQKGGGFGFQPGYFFMQFAKDRFGTKPAVADIPAELRIKVSNELVEKVTELTDVSNNATHWIMRAKVDDIPAGLDYVELEANEPTELDIDLGEKITPAELKMPAEDRRIGRAVTLDDDQFSSQFINDQRELINGNITGIAINSLSGASGAQISYLTEALNVRTEPHGIIVGDMRLTINNASATTILWENGLTTTTIPFSTTIETLTRAPILDITQSHYGWPVAHANLYKAGTLVGAVVLKMVQTSSVGLVALVLQYIQDGGHAETGNLNVGAAATIAVLGSGAPRGLGGGQWYSFASKPDAADFVDGDLILVTEGDDKGAWIKRSVETHPNADTDLGGETITPGTDLISGRAGAYEHMYYARNAFTGRDGTTSLPAGGTWADAPAALNYVDLSFRFATLDDGELQFKYSSNRTYSGSIAVSAGAHVILVPRDATDHTLYQITGLSRAAVHALRNYPWSFAEPDMSGYVVEHTLMMILPGSNPGTAALLTAGTDTVQRTWPASILSDAIPSGGGDPVVVLNIAGIATALSTTNTRYANISEAYFTQISNTDYDNSIMLIEWEERASARSGNAANNNTIVGQYFTSQIWMPAKYFKRRTNAVTWIASEQNVELYSLFSDGIAQIGFRKRTSQPTIYIGYLRITLYPQ